MTKPVTKSDFINFKPLERKYLAMVCESIIEGLKQDSEKQMTGIAKCNHCQEVYDIEESDSTSLDLFCSEDCESWYKKYDPNLERIKRLVNN